LNNVPEGEAVPKPKKLWEKFGSHPLLNIAGFLVGIIGLILYLFSIEKRELCYYVYPNRSTILKAGQITNLRVLWRDYEITNDLTVVHVQLWNRGKRAIRATDIVEPVLIQFGNPVRVVETTFRTMTRPNITKIKVDGENLLRIPENTNAIVGLPLTWQILEKNDACILQLIYEGSPSVPVKLTGAFEGQDRIVEKRVLAKADQWLFVFFGTVLCGFGLFLLSNVLRLNAKRPAKSWSDHVFFGFLFVLAMAIMVLGLGAFYTWFSSATLPLG